MPATRRILVVGAGYVGRRLLEALPPGTATGLRRSPGDDGSRSIVRADLDHEVAPLQDTDIVVYTVPPARVAPPDPRIEHLLNALVTAPWRFVYLSTSGVYGDCKGALVAENAALRPATDRARRRVAAEQQLAAWSREAGAELTILRVPGIYGPGRLRLEQLQRGEPVLREQDAGPGNRIHVDDLVTCLVAAMDSDRPAGVFNVGDGDYRSSTAFAHVVAQLSGLPGPPEIPMDEAMARFSDMRLSFLRESRRLDLTRMREVLRVTPRYADARDGIRASLGL